MMLRSTCSTDMWSPDKKVPVCFPGDVRSWTSSSRFAVSERLDAMYWEMLGVVHNLEFLVWRTGLGDRRSHKRRSLQARAKGG
jgi:hypothetical protein